MSYLSDNIDWILFILDGAKLTLMYAIIASSIGLVLGTVISMCNMSTFCALRFLSSLYVSIIRGTPVTLQLSISYFALPKIINYNLSGFQACIIALSLNSAAYISEIIRGGIKSVPKGQFEAAKSLSIPHWTMMKDIILPQAIKNILPPLTNEVINLIKESAIVGIIGEMDIMRRAQLVAAEKYTYFEPFVAAGIIYYSIILILSQIVKLIEKQYK